jgi:hypothetical protein
MTAGAAASADHCEKPCKTETAACIRDRCTGLAAESRHECNETCRAIGGCAAIRTLAYVWNECRSDASGITVRRELRIRRGNCAPVTVRTIGPAEPVPDPMHLCEGYGAIGFGDVSTVIGGFQRLAVTPDGSGVVFEVTNKVVDPSSFGGLSPDPIEEGFFYVRADGSGLRRLAPPSRARLFQFPPDGGIAVNVLSIAFSRDGRTVVYADLGPGPSGEEAVQVVTLDIATGRRTQLTSLPVPEEGVVNGTRFVNRNTVVFVIDNDQGDPLHFFTVNTDGSGFARLPPIVSRRGGPVVPDFSVVGGGTDLLTISTPGDASDEPVRHPRELFTWDGKNLLQLTHFGLYCTLSMFLGSRRRALFSTSADPLGTNPFHIKQIFSIDTLGRGLRQITRLVGVPVQCGGTPAGPCGDILGLQDPSTDTIVFKASCGDLRQGAFDDQIFAIRPDGSGLRQLTAARGCVVDADGAVTVELAGPFGYSAPSR